MRSRFQQFVHHADSSITVDGLPGVTCEVIEEQGKVIGRNLEAELGLPKYREDLERLAEPHGLSRYQLCFVVMDESETRFPGHYRLQPQHVGLCATCKLEYGHRGLLIGEVHTFIMGIGELRAQIPSLSGIELPQDLEGDVILGQATLYESRLAERIWWGIQHKIVTHACPLLFRPLSEPPLPMGTGALVEISLVSGDYPGCRNATILKTWEA